MLPTIHIQFLYINFTKKIKLKEKDKGIRVFKVIEYWQSPRKLLWGRG